MSRCFVFSVCVLWRVIVLLHDTTIPVANGCWRPKSIRGQLFNYFQSDFPRYCPSFIASPFMTLQRGFHRYSRFCFRDRSRNGHLPYPTRNCATLGRFSYVILLAIGSYKHFSVSLQRSDYIISLFSIKKVEFDV
jgi:hypothetical protein